MRTSSPLPAWARIGFIGGVAEKYGQQYRLEMKDLVYGLYCERVDEALTVYPGTRPTLERLHAAGVPMALASSADLIKVRANLRVGRHTV